MATVKVDRQIAITNNVICRHLKNATADSRGVISQDILSQLRNLTEHLMLKIYAKGQDIDVSYENICKAIDYVEGRGEWKALNRFHAFLQIVASHYTLDEENSERLMLKYYEYLVKIKKLVSDKLKMDILEDLSYFPLDTDETLQEYYERIADKINSHFVPATSKMERYYIQKVKPFFCGASIYYEITLTPANDYASKSNRIIAFTDLEISSNYAVRLTIENDQIKIMDKVMPILLITNWETSIRDCEYSNFSRIVTGKKVKIGAGEVRGLSKFLTETGYNLVELVTFSDEKFKNAIEKITVDARVTPFTQVLIACRNLIHSKKSGSNILRYLLLHMNNQIIKKQFGPNENERLSDLHLENGCIPFERMPFINSPKGHNPRLSDLFECIPVAGRRHELLARLIRNNTEIKGQLFTSIKDIEGFEDIPLLAQHYNDALWFGHRENSKLVIENGQIFINGYKEDTCFIIKKIKELTTSGIKNYASSVLAWLADPNNGVDSDEKKSAMMNMFTSSRVALIYGAAGTGKSTLINHISNFFSARTKLFLAQTNPAVDNLKRKVSASNSEYLTISKFVARENIQTDYDILIIDECSTVSNKAMRSVLEKAKYKLLVLVGDVFQIASIRFGNWFNAARAFVPVTAITELNNPYRSKNKGLLTLWDRVRKMDDTILESITRNGYSVKLDSSIFSAAEANEVILCLNYDGLYGINNINRFLQESNPNPSFDWGIQRFKVNDPVLFSDSLRFGSAIYNNMKGRITRIEILNAGSLLEQIQFDVELDCAINETDIWGTDLELIEDSSKETSVVRFCVNKTKSSDEDDDSESDVVPFQVAYAVSIHKAQGLEYKSVKIIITDEVDELITHSIFYTAITRAQEYLKIYWTPEVEKKVLDNIQPLNISKDVNLLKKYILGS